ncbi:hypothetical protein COO60DRAFT_249710 [Scenedesmus sp. NREL 46B-D3]|nr:hypothetical protein COO60DRAFT_249710 [Scenedesmus sp. NREL 46B-D3]
MYVGTVWVVVCTTVGFASRCFPDVCSTFTSAGSVAPIGCASLNRVPCCSGRRWLGMWPPGAPLAADAQNARKGWGGCCVLHSGISCVCLQESSLLCRALGA